MTGSCRAFEDWLDQGMPEPAAAARAHAATCGRCAPALEAALVLERALGEEVARAPRGFTDAVMARIALRSPAAGVAFAPPSLAWWLRAAAQPTTALALVLAAVVLAGRETIAAWAVAGQVALTEALASSMAATLLGPLGGLELPAVHEPVVRLGLALGLAPLVLLVSLALYRWSAGLPGPAIARAAR